MMQVNSSSTLKVKNLDVFKLSYRLALSIHKKTLSFPTIEQYAIGDQLRRATKSICANLVEGLGKQTTVAEERRFLSIAMGSAEEVKLWLMFCGDLGYIDMTTIQKFQDGYADVCRMLHGLIVKRRT